MKITAAMVDEVERLLAEGKISQRKIAKLVGMSRGTVNSIALGRRPRISAPPDELQPFSGPLVRCPGCGGKVFMPCLLCRVRKLKAIDQAPARCSADRTPRRCTPVEPRGAAADRGLPRFVTATASALAAAPAASSFTPAAAAC